MKKILIIEDDSAIAEIEKDYLTPTITSKNHFLPRYWPPA